MRRRLSSDEILARAFHAEGVANFLAPRHFYKFQGFSLEKRKALASLIDEHTMSSVDRWGETTDFFVDEMDIAAKLFRCGSELAFDGRAMAKKLRALVDAARSLEDAWAEIESDDSLFFGVGAATGIGHTLFDLPHSDDATWQRELARWERAQARRIQNDPVLNFLRFGLSKLSGTLDPFIDDFYKCNSLRSSPFARACIRQICWAWHGATGRMPTLSRSGPYTARMVPFEKCVRLAVSASEIGDDILRRSVAAYKEEIKSREKAQRRRSG